MHWALRKSYELRTRSASSKRILFLAVIETVMNGRGIALVFVLATSGCAALNGNTSSTCSIPITGSQALPHSATQHEFDSTGGSTSQPTNVVPSVKYACSELSESEAYSLLRSGHYYLDADGDGYPCEWGSKERIFVQPPPTTKSSNCHHVSGYRKKNGTYVQGYTRCR